MQQDTNTSSEQIQGGGNNNGLAGARSAATLPSQPSLFSSVNPFLNVHNSTSLSLKSIQSTFAALPDFWKFNQNSNNGFNSHSNVSQHNQVSQQVQINGYNGFNHPQSPVAEFLLQQHQQSQNTASSLVSLLNMNMNQNSIGSLLQLPEIFNRSLSIRVDGDNKRFGALPTEWFNELQNQGHQQPGNRFSFNNLNSSQNNNSTENIPPPFKRVNSSAHRDNMYQNSSHLPYNQNQNLNLEPVESVASLNSIGNMMNSHEHVINGNLAQRATKSKIAKVEGDDSLSNTSSSRSNPSSRSRLPSSVLNGVNVVSTSTNNARWNSWSHEEEVFLVISVLDRFFRRGSLASASSGKAAVGAENIDCWVQIKDTYDRICNAWHSLQENRSKPDLIQRSTSALCRHFKIMKVRAAEGDINGTNEGNFRKYLREWDTVLNANGRLIRDGL